MLFSAYRPPFNQWRMSSALTENTKKELQRKEVEEINNKPRNWNSNPNMERPGGRRERIALDIRGNFTLLLSQQDGKPEVEDGGE